MFARKEDSCYIDTLDPATLNEYLSSFYLGIRKKDESEYEPNYLKNIQQSRKALTKAKLSKINNRR